MYSYKIYGLLVSSDLEIHEAYQIDEQKTYDVTIRSDLAENKGDEDLTDYERETLKKVGGYRRYSKDKVAGLGIADVGFFTMKGGKEITYWLKDGANAEHVRQIMLCHCLNIIMMQRSIVSIHGSGLINDGKGLIISGNSGAGKSTLSTALLAKGLGYMADDVNAIDLSGGSVMMQPAFPQRKLCVDTAVHFGFDLNNYSIIPSPEKEKYGVRVTENFSTDAVALKTIVIIEPKEIEEVRIRQILGSEKLKCVVNNVFAKEDYDKVGFGPIEFGQCLKIAEAVDIYIMNRPLVGKTVDKQIEKLSDCDIIGKQLELH